MSCPAYFPAFIKNPERIPQIQFPDNVWVGTTVTNENGDWKNVEEIKKVDAKVRFVSFEPLLGPLPDSVCLDSLQWVIVGKLTGSRRVQLDSYWISHIKNEAHRHNIPIFIKNNILNECLDIPKIQEFPRA